MPDTDRRSERAMTQEDAYRAYDCVRKEFPDYANFEGCPWVETIDRTWVRSNAGYLLEVTPTQVKVSGPAFEAEWGVMQVTMKDFYLDPEMKVPLSEAPIG